MSDKILDLEGFHDVATLYSYKVYISGYCNGRWVGKLVDEEGKTISLFGMEQDDICPSHDKEVTENFTKKLFEEYKKN
jgi:hypothetical protein